MNVEVIEKTFDCGDHASLSLSNIRGEIVIQRGEESTIAVHVEKNIDSGDADHTEIELYQQETGKVIARTRYDLPGNLFFRRNIPCKVAYQVSVPSNCDLELHGVSNAANIQGISGVMDISTVSGDLVLKSLTGELTLKSVSGDIQAENIDAAVQIETVSGDARMEASNIPNLRGKTVSGDLKFETPLGKGPYDFHSVSGDVRLKLMPLSGVTIISSSLSGDIRTEVPLSSSNHTRGKHQAEIMGGGVDIFHKSVSGDFFLDGSDGEQPPIQMPATQHDLVERPTNSEILASIERGEMSVDQAVGLLEEAGRN